MNSHQRRTVRRLIQKQELINLIVCRLKGHKIIDRYVFTDHDMPNIEKFCQTCFEAKRSKLYIDLSNLRLKILPVTPNPKWKTLIYENTKTK